MKIDQSQTCVLVGSYIKRVRSLQNECCGLGSEVGVHEHGFSSRGLQLDIWKESLMGSSSLPSHFHGWGTCQSCIEAKLRPKPTPCGIHLHTVWDTCFDEGIAVKLETYRESTW